MCMGNNRRHWVHPCVSAHGHAVVWSGEEESQKPERHAITAMKAFLFSTQLKSEMEWGQSLPCHFGGN